VLNRQSLRIDEQVNLESFGLEPSNELRAGHADQLEREAAHVRRGVGLVTTAAFEKRTYAGPTICRSSKIRPSARCRCAFTHQLAHGADMLLRVQRAPRACRR